MTTKLDNETNCKKPADLKAEKDSSKDANSNDASHAKQTSEDPNNSKVNSTSNDTRSTPLDSLSDELEEHYKDLQHYSNQNNDHHPVPSLPPAAHHAPPQDSSELLSPWWSEETPDTATQPETDAPNQQQQQQQQQQEQPQQQQHPQQQQPQQPEQPPSQSSPDNEYIRYILRYGRSATDRQGTEVWEEKCVIWTKDPTKVEKAIESAIGGPDKTTTTSTTTPAKASSPPDLSPCSMICLFRESQERKRLKREQLSTWNPFYGNWLVVTHTQAALAEHMKETDIVRKDSPQYYSIELGERFGRLDQDVAMFMKKTFTPVQELGRRYMNSWKDGTQADFFTRFMASAQRGDGLFLLRDSLRRMMESMTGSDDKKNGGDDHK